MKQIDRFQSLGLFDSRVPRYTSYPTAPVFTPDITDAEQARALRALDPDEPVSVYLHIPFCERLCWFCACRTQGTQTLKPVENYISTLEQELELVAPLLPQGLRMGRMHWGGGTPTILPPVLIRRLAQAVKVVFPQTEDWEFSVEIDPTLVDSQKISALADEGMNRASIGIQDFDPLVQQAIGRQQPFDVTRACTDDLRAAGIRSLNADLVYGLPYQTPTRMADTLDKVLMLQPDRLALFGYAHVPWVAKRQKLINETTLPDDMARFYLAKQAADVFQQGEYRAIGIDHFAKLGDGLAVAAQTGRLRRNFQGYTDDTCATLIGFGASSISRFASGYVQNAAATSAYVERITAGLLAGVRGHILSDEDALRGRAIEMLMCDFRIDLQELRRNFGDLTDVLKPDLHRTAKRYGDFLQLYEDRLEILPDGIPLTRLIASSFDAHVPDGVRYSRAS